MESGVIELWSLSLTRPEDGSTTLPGVSVTAALFTRLEPFMCHVSSVQRLEWRRTTSQASGGDCKRILLASCGADHCVRIFEVSVA